MFYTVFWVILWLIAGGQSLSIGTPVFWALIVAIIADLYFVGWGRRWYFRP